MPSQQSRRTVGGRLWRQPSLTREGNCSSNTPIGINTHCQTEASGQVTICMGPAAPSTNCPSYGDRGIDWVVCVKVVWGCVEVEEGGLQVKIHALLHSSNHASGAALDLARARYPCGPVAALANDMSNVH